MPHVNMEALARDFEAGASSKDLRDSYHIGGRALIRKLVEARRRNLVSEESLARLVVDSTKHEFPRDPEARLEAILSCVNTELKQATMLVLDRYPASCGDILNRVSAITDCDIPVYRTFSEYCIQTLSPIGFLVEELFAAEGWAARYFSLSEPGVVYGQPIAAFSLRYAVDHNISLFQLFGSVVSSGDSRSPYNRTKIVELVDSGHKTLADLERLTGLNTTNVNRHLENLEGAEVLITDSHGLGATKKYEWARGDPAHVQKVKRCEAMTKKVAQYLHQKGKGDSITIAQELGTQKELVNRILNGLEDQGFVKGSAFETDIILYTNGPAMLEYVNCVRAALGGKLGAMKEQLKEFRQDEAFFRRYLNAGIELYRSVSPLFNRISAAEHEKSIMDFVRDYKDRNSRGPRYSEIERIFPPRHSSVNNCLTALVSSGTLTKIRTNREVRYEPTD